MKDDIYWALIVVFFVIVASIGIVAFTVDNSRHHLKNDKIYACPNGDWAGTTAQMKMITQANHDRYFYCPIDGKYLGRQFATDPYPIGQEG